MICRDFWSWCWKASNQFYYSLQISSSVSKRFINVCQVWVCVVLVWLYLQWNVKWTVKETSCWMVEDRFYLDQLIFMVDWALSITDQSLFVFINVHSAKCSYVLTIQKHLQLLQTTETLLKNWRSLLQKVAFAIYNIGTMKCYFSFLLLPLFPK